MTLAVPVPRETSTRNIAADRLRAGQRARAGLRDPEFASPEQERFYRSETREILYAGAMGAGKSRILCEKAWGLAIAHPGAELALFRKVRASMAATTERTFWTEVADARYVVGRNQTENWVDLAQPGQRPSRVWFLGLDKDPITGLASKVGSLNLDWAGVDEAIELTDVDWMQILGRLRRDAVGYRQIAAVTNPGGPNHWLKRRFTPPNEDQTYIQAVTNRFLPDDYQAVLASLGTGYMAQRLGQGLWVAAEGTIYLLPDTQIKVVEQTDWKRVIGGIDWGYVHAFAAEVVGETGSGTRATIAEIYERGALLPALIERLKELQTELNVDAWYADPSEPANIAQCKAAGIRIVKATNDVIPGITAVNAAIKGGMTVSPTCTGLLDEIPEYTWQRDRSSGDEKEKPIELHDDACDAWRYAVMGLDRPEHGILAYYRSLVAGAPIPDAPAA